ncbi:cation:proton antiporter [Candidatus Uhrbacteria bacterium]|nr:cation:proton antiporter [Candidatus Uhrbacteria bacterium]
MALVLLFIGALLLVARVGAMAEKIGQPAVLGELLLGAALSAVVSVTGWQGIRHLLQDPAVLFCASVGVILLLFKTGLESNINDMLRVGLRALLVACVGVALPFIGGYVTSGLLMPDTTFNARLFIGATLTATSVGLTARVFDDLKIKDSREARIVLGAAVIDDVIGLIILAVVSGIVSSGSVSWSGGAWLLGKSVLFLGLALFLGTALAPKLTAAFSRIHEGVGMKMAIALMFCFGLAYASVALVGLAPIVGAFAAGLVLDHVHFRQFSSEKNVEDLIEGIAIFFVPIFFVYTGLQVDLTVFQDLALVGNAIAITMVAIVGKVLCGFVSGPGTNHWLVGFGMVPRGEVGLIFLAMGKQLNVVNDRIFAMGVIMVMLSTLLTPPILTVIIRRQSPRAIV